MHGTPLLSAKGNHDQDYTPEDTTDAAAAAAIAAQQQHYKQQYNGSQSGVQAAHQPIQPPPPIQPQYQQPPPPPPQSKAMALGQGDNRSGDNKSIGEIGNAINIVFGLLATRALTYFPILYYTHCRKTLK